jgi:protein-tyrosine sulfotransferase
MKDSYEGIIVLGSPRSGTTLLRRLLDAHEAICCPPETHLLNACSRFLREERFGPDFFMGVGTGLSFSGFTEHEILDRLRDLVLSFVREICARQGKRRWAEKSAFDAFHVDNIYRLFGDSCRYLCVFRHGLDVVCSLKEFSDKTEAFVGELHDYICRYNSPFEAFAHAWVDVNARLLQLVADHPGVCCPVRYEDLVMDPVAELSRIFDFLDEPTDVKALLEWAFVRKEAVGLGDWKTYQTSRVVDASIGRWTGMTKDTIGRLAKVVNPTLETLGYEPVAEGKVMSEEQARRRLKLAYMAAKNRSQVSHGVTG